MKATTKRMIAMCLALLLTLTGLGAAAPLAAAAGTELASYNVQTFYQSKAPDDSKQGSVVSIDQAGWLWQFGYYIGVVVVMGTVGSPVIRHRADGRSSAVENCFR